MVDPCSFTVPAIAGSISGVIVVAAGVVVIVIIVCVQYLKFKECLEFEQSVVVKLPSFVKLVSPFRKPIYKSTFLVRFIVYLILPSAPGQFLGCMAMVINARNLM